MLEGLGDNRHRFLIESFKPGDVYHADALYMQGKSLFCRTSKYLTPPFEVAHGGGIFRSVTVDFDTWEDADLKELTDKVMSAFGMRSSASHTEFIRSRETGKLYFLETSSRVGGPHLSDMVEVSRGSICGGNGQGSKTLLPKAKNTSFHRSARNLPGVLICLSRYESPDMFALPGPGSGLATAKEKPRRAHRAVAR